MENEDIPMLQSIDPDDDDDDDDDVEDVTSAQALITNLRDGPPLLRQRCDVRTTGVFSGKKSTLLSLQ
jgi:hypothetical protein